MFRHLSHIQGALNCTCPVFSSTNPSMSHSHLSTWMTQCCSVGSGRNTAHGAQRGRSGESADSEIRIQIPALPLTVVEPQASFSTILHLSLLICKMVLLTPTPPIGLLQELKKMIWGNVFASVVDLDSRTQ